MATSDLLNELSKDTFKVDTELEKRLSAALLTQLEDASGDISGLAVKWYVLLLGCVSRSCATKGPCTSNTCWCGVTFLKIEPED